MNVLVVGSGVLAEKIGEGAAQAGASVEHSEAFRDGFDLVFLEASKASPGVKGNVALFYARGLEFGNPFEKFLSKLDTASCRLVNQILLEKKGLLKSKLEEIDFERARAFGERTVRNLSGVRVEKPNEKQKIRGYRKRF